MCAAKMKMVEEKHEEYGRIVIFKFEIFDYSFFWFWSLYKIHFLVLVPLPGDSSSNLPHQPLPHHPLLATCTFL